MLRVLAGLLLALNLAVFAWIQGWLSPLVMPPMSSEREPERIALQQRPDSVRLLGPKAAEQAQRAASAAEQSQRAAATAAATNRPASSAASAASAAGPAASRAASAGR